MDKVENRPPPSGEEDALKREQEEQVKRDLLSSIVDTAARERLSRISLVSPERARQIENVLLRMAQSGQLRGRVSEDQLIDLLNQMESNNNATQSKSTIVYHRRKGIDDDFDI